MKITTLCFCVTKDGLVLLGMKKQGFGEGKWNGYGGKVKSGETPEQATVRELREESGVVAREEDLEKVATAHFSFAGVPTIFCHVYLVRSWRGTPKETEEMRPQWYAQGELPFGEMWAADARWLPLVFAGEKIEVEVDFSEDGSVVEMFKHVPAHFA